MGTVRGRPAWRRPRRLSPQRWCLVDPPSGEAAAVGLRRLGRRCCERRETARCAEPSPVRLDWTAFEMYRVEAGLRVGLGRRRQFRDRSSWRLAERDGWRCLMLAPVCRHRSDQDPSNSLRRSARPVQQAVDDYPVHQVRVALMTTLVDPVANRISEASTRLHLPTPLRLPTSPCAHGQALHVH